MAKKENEKMKRDVKDFFGNIENDFQKIKNILSSITFPKTKNSFSQTDTENAWKNKIISKSIKYTFFVVSTNKKCLLNNSWHTTHKTTCHFF